MRKCLVCGDDSKNIFSVTILKKYLIDYFRCPSCGFLQTETPYWLDESYQKAILSSDTGLVKRNMFLVNFTAELLVKYYDVKRKFLDYGGGYGLFVRLMRDKGFNFYRQDVYCENVFATYFDIQDLPEEEQHFELLTAFEVFEHLVNPAITIKQMLEYSDAILFSTILQPTDQIEGLRTWKYLVTHSGQHVSFFNLKSLQVLAEQYQVFLYTDGSGLHLFSKNKLPSNPFNQKRWLKRLWNKARKTFHLQSPNTQLTGLTQADCDFIVEKITQLS